MSLYFRPEKAVLGDVIPYYDNAVHPGSHGNCEDKTV